MNDLNVYTNVGNFKGPDEEENVVYWDCNICLVQWSGWGHWRYAHCRSGGSLAAHLHNWYEDGGGSVILLQSRCD